MAVPPTGQPTTPPTTGAAVAGPRVRDGGLRSIGTALRWTGYTLFFLMVFVPTSYQGLKAVLLALVLAGICADVAGRGRLPLDRRLLLMSIAFAGVGAFFVLRGLAFGAPGALNMFNVYVTWPLVFTVLVAGAADGATLRGLARVLVTAANAVALYSIIYVLWAAGYWPDALYYPLDQGQAIGFYGAYVEFNLYAISSLLFLTPFLTTALFVFPTVGAPVARRTLWVSLALNLVTVLLTGRRALLLLLPLAPILALIARSWLPAAVKRESRTRVTRAVVGAVSLAGVLVAAIGAAGAFVPAGFVEMLASGFRFNSDPVAMGRRDQLMALLNGWAAQPLLGSGHGAPAPGVIRSVDMPWAYELSYVALLYHTGAVGFAIYALGAAWIGVMCYRIARSGWRDAPSLMAVFVGSTSFMIANATNPYLEKYDYIWIIFLPLAFINSYLVNRSHTAHAL
jgi:hypothetical protein